MLPLAEPLAPDVCIARGLMPQVDADDIPDLLEFLQGRGVAHVRADIDARLFRAHQRIVLSKVRGIIRAGSLLLEKPILSANDYYIVDGNHRVAAAHIQHATIPAFILDRPFREAIAEVFTFPRTYAYGDGVVHPVRN